MTFAEPGISRSPVLSSQETRRGTKWAEVWRREDIHGSVKNSSFSTERERIKSISGRKHAEESSTVDVSCSCSTYGSRNQLWQESWVFRKIKIQRLDELTAKRSSVFYQLLSRWKRTARVENSLDRSNRKSLGASTRISVVGEKIVLRR